VVSAVLAVLALVLGSLGVTGAAEAAPRWPTLMSVECTSPVAAASGPGGEASSLCTVLVNGTETDRPQGIVTFTSSRGSGFSAAACNLRKDSRPAAPKNRAFCQVRYEPPGAGSLTRTDTITAYFGHSRLIFGQSNTFRPATAQAKVDVKPLDYYANTPGMELTCNDPIPAGVAGVCKVRLTGIAPIFSPRGRVTFTSSRPKGINANNSSCELVDDFFGASSCVMAYVPPDAGYPKRKDTITATYLGESDAQYKKATASDTFSVPSLF
jgi:hypothetical protein